MIALLGFVMAALAAPFKLKSRLEAENATLRHQLTVLRRKVPGRARLTNNDRWFFIQLYRWFPPILNVLTIIRPETLVRWHRAGFRGYWRWKSRQGGGRPQIDAELRALIRRMSIENPVPSENSIRHLIRAASENRGIIRCDVCHAARARVICLRSPQIEASTPGGEPVSAPSTQYRLAAASASASIAR